MNKKPYRKAEYLPAPQRATRDFTFTLRFELPKEADDPMVHVRALYEAGCNDALIGIGTRGRIALDFTREAESFWAALESATRDVQKAIPGAQLREANMEAGYLLGDDAE